VCFQNVHRQKLHPVVILIVELVEGGNLPPERRSGVGAEDQGDGPLREELTARAAQTDLEGRVHLTGRLPRLEALALAGGADLFAFASQTETQGLVLAEALAVGLPVVALDGPGVRGSVDDGVDGLVVVPRDLPPASALAAALVDLAADRDRRAVLAAGAAAGAARFSASAWIDRIVALYRELLASRA